MTPTEILNYCHKNNIELEPTDKGTIRINITDTSTWSEELKAAIVTHKPALIRLLNTQSVFEAPEIIECENAKCSCDCLYPDNIFKCPWNLPEGTYKWNECEWKRVVH